MLSSLQSQKRLKNTHPSKFLGNVESWAWDCVIRTMRQDEWAGEVSVMEELLGTRVLWVSELVLVLTCSARLVLALTSIFFSVKYEK